MRPGKWMWVVLNYKNVLLFDRKPRQERPGWYWYYLSDGVEHFSMVNSCYKEWKRYTGITLEPGVPTRVRLHGEVK